jgi:hypothetical protein
MDLLRRLTLPEDVPGAMYLHSMPGRYEPLQRVWADVARLCITQIVCLAPFHEVAATSPSYAAAIDQGTVPCRIRTFPIADFDRPADLEGFWLLARETADVLRRGEHVLVHCGAGIGRTGTFAVAVLLALGVRLEHAEPIVRAAGSRPETDAQRQALQAVLDAGRPPSR